MDHPEINGKPAVKITVSAAEKIGLPKFSNIDIGPVSITRFVEDDDEVVGKAIRDGQEFVELILGEERERIVEGFAARGVEV